jgi:hypothetical protein
MDIRAMGTAVSRRSLARWEYRAVRRVWPSSRKVISGLVGSGAVRCALPTSPYQQMGTGHPEEVHRDDDRGRTVARGDRRRDERNAGRRPNVHGLWRDITVCERPAGTMPAGHPRDRTTCDGCAGKLCTGGTGAFRRGVRIASILIRPVSKLRRNPAVSVATHVSAGVG